MKLLTSLWLTLLSMLGNAQTKDTFLKKIDTLNSLLIAYDQLSPFSEDENRFDLIDSIQAVCVIRLLDVLNDKRIVQYQIENILHIQVSKSDDNNIFLMSLDEKTGGSYQANIAFIHYRLANGDVIGKQLELEEGDAVSTSSYGHVYGLDSLHTSYIVIGNVVTCSTCMAYTALILQFNKELNTEKTAFDISALYQMDGRLYDIIAFDYDETNKVFTYEYLEEQDDNTNIWHKYRGKFQYMDDEFIEIEKSEFWGKQP